MTSPTDLPTDVATLQALLIASEERNVRKEDRIIRLEKLLADFKRALYGAKSEKGHPDQYHLALEDIETAMAVVHAEDEAVDPPKATAAAKPRAGRGVLPKHLLRIEEVIAPDDVICGCGAERHIIGEDVSERLDIVPAQFRVLVTRRPKYACRSCEAGIIQAVRRQGFWHQWQLKLREILAHLVGFIMRRAVCDASVALRVSFV